MTPAKSRALRLIVLVALSACIGDPMGPGGMRVALDGVQADSVLVGAPGEVVQGGVGVRVTDAAGAPIPGASVAWSAVGKVSAVKR